MKPIKAYYYPGKVPQIELIPIDESAAFIIRSWRNLPEVRRCFFDQGEISIPQQQKWFSRYLDDDTDLCWLVEFPNEVAVGTISLSHLQNSTAEIGRLIVDPRWTGRGIGTLIEKAATRYGFEELHLSMIYTSVKEDNLSTLKVVKAAGYTEVRRENGAIYFEQQNHSEDKS